MAYQQRQTFVSQRNQAVAGRLNIEAQSILTGRSALDGPGGDGRAFKELLAARLIAPPDDSALLTAAAERVTTGKIITTGVDLNRPCAAAPPGTGSPSQAPTATCASSTPTPDNPKDHR